MYAESYKNGVLLQIWIQPKASKAKVVGIHNDMLKVSVKSPPVEGRANQECLDILSNLFNIPKNHISIISGLQGRHKKIYLEGIALKDVDDKIENILRAKK